MNKTTIFFRVDAHAKFGMGHVFRCLNYAQGLRELLPVEPCFLMKRCSLETGIRDYLGRAGIPYQIVSADDDYREDFRLTRRIIAEKEPAVVFTDLLNPDPSDRDLNDDAELVFEEAAAYVKGLREAGVTVFSITDEIEDITIKPDVVISAGNQFPEKYAGLEKGTMYLIGPEYYVVPQDIAEFSTVPKVIPEIAKDVLVFFGGSDVDGFAEKCVSALIGSEELHTRVILGAATDEAEATAVRMRKMGAEVYFNVPKIAPFMIDADIAITHGGNTTFELAAAGTPFITMCRRERQLKHAEYLQGRGVSVSLGYGFDAAEEEILETVLSLTADNKKRISMSRAGRRMVDGKGIERIAAVLQEILPGAETRQPGK